MLPCQIASLFHFTFYGHCTFISCSNTHFKLCWKHFARVSWFYASKWGFFFRNFVIINSFVKYMCFPSIWAMKIITIFKYYTHLYRMHIGFHQEDICPHYWPNSPSLIFTNCLETIYRNNNDTLLRNMKWLMNKHLELHNIAIKRILS